MIEIYNKKELSELNIFLKLVHSINNIHFNFILIVES